MGKEVYIWQSSCWWLNLEQQWLLRGKIRSTAWSSINWHYSGAKTWRKYLGHIYQFWCQMGCWRSYEAIFDGFLRRMMSQASRQDYKITNYSLSRCRYYPHTEAHISRRWLHELIGVQTWGFNTISHSSITSQRSHVGARLTGSVTSPFFSFVLHCIIFNSP
jgi:hypothetical protein